MSKCLEMLRERNLPRLFVDVSLEKSQIVEIQDSSFHYLHHVLRKKPEDFVLLLDGKTGLWRAQIQEIRKKSLILIVLEQMKVFQNSSDVCLYFAPIRSHRLDFLIEKATELGIQKFQPIATKYTQIRDIKPDKLTKIAIEASEQCERLDIPLIEPLKPFKDVLNSYPQDRKDRVLLFADETLEGKSIYSIIQKTEKKNFDILIGPEGGFSGDENTFLKSLPFVQSCHLGPRILRAETAAIFGISCIMSCLFHGD